jgi:hypothetical protein
MGRGEVDRIEERGRRDAWFRREKLSYEAAALLLALPSRSHAFDVHVGPPSPGDTPDPPRRCCSSRPRAATRFDRIPFHRWLAARDGGNDEAVPRSISSMTMHHRTRITHYSGLDLHIDHADARRCVVRRARHALCIGSSRTAN